MISTPELIGSLADQARPVIPLRSPWLRCVGWLAVAVLVVATLASCHGLRADLLDKIRQPPFLVQEIALLFTAAMAAMAAFLLSLPDRSPAWGLLPLPSLGVWISSFRFASFTDWLMHADSRAMLGESARCLETIILVGLPLSLLLLIMLRSAGPFRPKITAALGGLAVAAVALVALSLLHKIDAILTVLVWSVGTLAVFAVLGGSASRRLFPFAR